MDTPNLLEEALTLALKLTPKERLQLIVNRLMHRLDMSDWTNLEIDDPVEWVKEQRSQERRQRLGDCGEDE